MNNLIQNKIKSYNKLQYGSGPMSVPDIISEKANKIHVQLYNDALNKLLETLAMESYQYDESIVTFKFGDMFYNKFTSKNINEYINNFKSQYKDTHKITEIKADDYLSPSSVIITTTTYPFKKTVYDLSQYWNFVQYYKNQELKNIVLNDETQKYSQLDYIDYVNGTCILKSKFGEITVVPLNYINNDIEKSDNMSLANTFSHKINNI